MYIIWMVFIVLSLLLVSVNSKKKKSMKNYLQLPTAKTPMHKKHVDNSCDQICRGIRSIPNLNI